MNDAHWHLVVNHFPIIGTIFGLGILISGLVLKNKTAVNIAYILFVISAIFGFASMYTGEGAEEMVENLPNVGDQIIHEHEEMAEKAIVFMAILGILSFVNLFALIRSLSFAKILTYVTLIFSLLTFGIYAKTGNLGGQIRHTEIRTNAVTNNHSGAIENRNQKSEDNKEDDD